MPVPSTIIAVPTPAAISVSDLVNSPQNLFPFWSTVSQIILKEDLNKIGIFTVEINFHSEVKAKISVKIDKIKSK